jgi:5-methylcytosine-specific restriction protein A
VFAAGATSVAHVETIVRELDTPAARRLDPGRRAGAEAELADKAGVYTPSELADYARTLIERLDQDGAGEPDEDPEQVNRLTLTPHRDGSGGRIAGEFDSLAFEAIATAIDAAAKPLTEDDNRPLPERQAEALAEICGYVLDHGDDVLPQTGGERPHMSVIIGLADLEARARAAMLDFGGILTPAQLRLLACDARVVPIVMNGIPQPLDVGRATRVIPDGLRRAVIARDRGCAHAGCRRPPSWSEIHHITPWEEGGETSLANCVMLCRFHHRLMHRPGWIVRIRDGRPEFFPPSWIDYEQRPRRQPTIHAA